jgi:CRP-like cAMP-binding protein/PAS domain-containing protein
MKANRRPPPGRGQDRHGWGRMDGEANFRDMIRRFAQSAHALQAFDAGEVDAVVDPSTGSAILLGEPQSPDFAARTKAERALQQSNRFARASLDRLATYICVLDSAGTIIMTNKAWRAFGVANEGMGAGLPEGANYLQACDNTRGEQRLDGLAVAAGIRRVIAGEYGLFRYPYARVPPQGRCGLNLSVSGFPGEGAVSVRISHERATGLDHAHPPPSPRVPVGGRVPLSNRLLSALCRDGYERLVAAGLEPVILNGRKVLFEPGQAIRHVHFPQECVVSLLMPIAGHPATEVGLVGREGVVGFAAAPGIGTSPVRALVQQPGTAMRMPSAQFRKLLQENPQLQRELHRFNHALMTQVMRTSACHRFHVLEQRLARKLLMIRDRVRSDEFGVIHEFLADMLGVRRAGVTLAACALQQRQLIAYSRGKLKILDPEGLEAAACSCYSSLTHA